MAKQVLSAKQLLAVLRREPGHEKIAAKLYGSRISALSMVTVLAECKLAGHDVVASWQAISQLDITFVPLDVDQAIQMAADMDSLDVSFSAIEDLAYRTIAR